VERQYLRGCFDTDGKMRLNFIGLHTYPASAPNAEPTAWIGPTSDMTATGLVRHSYPATWANTQRTGPWGVAAESINHYAMGASRLFASNVYGSRVMVPIARILASHHQPTPADYNRVFNQASLLLKRSSSFAQMFGIKTCVGTETPLTVPPTVASRLRCAGENPQSSATIKRLYEGIFRHIQKAYPINYYWIWTPEPWTWVGNTPAKTAAVLRDLKLAVAAARAVHARFQIATSGWVLGPKSNRTLLDNILPPGAPMNALNRDVGFRPVTPAFARIHAHPTWAIPWMQDHPDLLMPQLYVTRVFQNASQARSYHCSGLIGIFWRPRIIGPNISAMAQEGWVHRHPRTQDAFVLNFYQKWAQPRFGKAAAAPIASLLASIDNRLPQTCQWIGGPGGIPVSAKPWSKVMVQYAFVQRFAALRHLVKGAGQSTSLRLLDAPVPVHADDCKMRVSAGSPAAYCAEDQTRQKRCRSAPYRPLHRDADSNCPG